MDSAIIRGVDGSRRSSRVLVVEDDEGVARTVRSGLEASGYEVSQAETGEEALRLLPAFQPHVLVLDLNLPGLRGLDVLKVIRDQKHDVRVLILTSHNEVEDRVAGLRKGADDYLGKPFSLAELEARIEALLRRGQPESLASTLHLADLVLDTQARTAWRSGLRLTLTHREFELLLYLMDHRGRTVSREMLARDVWRETSRFTPIDNVIDVQMTRLRRKVDDPFPAKLLHTVRGVGYSLREYES